MKRKKEQQSYRKLEDVAPCLLRYEYIQIRAIVLDFGSGSIRGICFILYHVIDARELSF